MIWFPISIVFLLEIFVQLISNLNARIFINLLWATF